ncbi:hypothetical protein I553_0407 [Mycobacterium xenopi 4042]|uniref:Uncharacterized protein n=1 Tax=Mycobacterium xenopi 4042 TaxID=1299334 RepID=X7YL02_MYCXE|nr:hypothetical protein I553_0407 [Mycobacterium xenopi 4042]
MVLISVGASKITAGRRGQTRRQQLAEAARSGGMVDEQIGPPCSNNSCRHRPHGASNRPLASTHASASSLPPPVECRALTTPHSAQRPRPYETFSTLHPVTTRPSSTSAAAPTRNRE